jgi:hypothetical protein
VEIVRLAHVGALVLAWTFAGCYRYLPVTPEAVPPGEAVRIRLTPEEAANFPDLRLTEGRLLEGRLFHASESMLTLETTVGVNDPQRGTRALVQRVEIPRGAMVELERRELDRARTGFLVAGGTAVVTAVVVSQLRKGSGSDDPPGGGGVEATRVPLLRLRWGF